MGLATVERRGDAYYKSYPEGQDNLWIREMAAYNLLPWACPELLNWGERWLETERCVPILDLEWEASRAYIEPLRELIGKINAAGWWHCDVSLVNVVIHYYRGVLLIDWENLRPASSTISYDLFGARAAGVSQSVWKPHQPDGVWWGGGWKYHPATYWKL